jgi:hypothetical protein
MTKSNESPSTIILNGRRYRELTVVQWIQWELHTKHDYPRNFYMRTPVQFEGRYYWDEGPVDIEKET